MEPIADAAVDRARVQSVMEKVRHLEIRTRGLVDQALAGSYQSAFRGRGIDFDRVREYVAGDETRTIDWNVTARAGRPFVKQFREERELALMLVVDVSASGDFGSTSHRKRELAAELACVLALSAIRNNDLVGLIAFSDRVERFVPPRKGRAHALRVVREILSCKPEGLTTDLAGAVHLAGSICKRRAVLALISDMELNGDRSVALESFRRSATPVAMRHDVIAFHVRDPHERELPDVGLLVLEDAETGEVVRIDTARRKVRGKFAELVARRAEETRGVLRRSGIDITDVDTSRPFVPVVHAFFAARARRAR